MTEANWNGHPGPDQLLALGEGVLPEALEAEVRVHLEGCALCRGLRTDLESITMPSVAELERVRGRLFGRRMWGYGVAAGLAACLAIGWMVWSSRVPAPAPEVARVVKQPEIVTRLVLVKAPLRLALPLAVTLRGQSKGEDDGYLRELGKALRGYRNDKYSEAVVALEELAQRYPQAVEPLFYGGVSRLMMGERQAALAALEKAMGMGSEALADDLIWYLAVAYERNGRWADARGLLDQLCGREGSYRAAACEGLVGR